jgi:NADPH:quinone reductase-like Zn-dependent oxidoreductase
MTTITATTTIMILLFQVWNLQVQSLMIQLGRIKNMIVYVVSQDLVHMRILLVSHLHIYLYLLPLPDHWSYAQGASFIVQALTAWHGLVEIGRMPLLTNNNSKPFIVIVHSAAGGVGLWASEIAARRGAIVLGIIGDKNKEQFFYNRIKHISSDSTVMIRGKERDFKYRLAQKLKEIHASTTSTTTTTNANANATRTLPPLGACDDDDASLDLLEMSKCGYGADIVMESLGGEYFHSSFDSLNDGGAIVTFGSSSYSTPGRGGFNIIRLIYRYITRPKIDPGDLVSRNIRLSGFNLIFLTERTTQLRKELNECISCLSGRDVNAPVTKDINNNVDEDMTLDLVSPPLIGDTFDFRNEAVDAMEKLKGGKTVGKVVLINNSNNAGSI